MCEGEGWTISVSLNCRLVENYAKVHVNVGLPETGMLWRPQTSRYGGDSLLSTPAVTSRATSEEPLFITTQPCSLDGDCKGESDH